MKISVIIPSFNQAGFIKQTLESILGQRTSYEPEIHVMDGGSTDGTIDILKSYGSRIHWVSEKDKGQADAVNNGIKKATGDVIGWLNSDDLYEPDTLQTVMDHFSRNPDCQWLYGKCRIIDETGIEIMKGITSYKNLSLKRFRFSRLMLENYISQPTVFFRKELFNKVGSLDTSLHYTMDYDLWLRFGREFPACVVNNYLASFRRHGESKSETGFKLQFKEEYEVFLRYNPSSFSRLAHKFNMYKIIWAYRLINFF